MKILLLTTRIPFPLSNGEDLRVFHFAKHLSEHHDLHLLAYGCNAPPPPEVAGYFRSIHTVEPAPIDASKRRKSLVKAFDSLSPKKMCYFDPHIVAKLGHVMKQPFDILWIPAWEMIPYAKDIRGIPIVLDVMDDGVLELARELRSSDSFKNVAVNLKRLLVTYLFERKYFQNAGLCVFVTDRDAAVFRKICPKAKILVIPNGVDSEYFRPLGSHEDFPSLIFEGNMNFFPNVDAVEYFCREIFPGVLTVVPKVKLYIVGRNPAPEVVALASNHIIVTGYVEDVRPYLDQASVFVCPMRKGAGIKNKLLQAWAMAKPVVATTTAVGGVQAVEEVNVLIGDNPDRFAQQVNRLLGDAGLRHRIGRQGLKTVLQHHSWAQQVQQLESKFAEL